MWSAGLRLPRSGLYSFFNLEVAEVTFGVPNSSSVGMRLLLKFCFALSIVLYFYLFKC